MIRQSKSLETAAHEAGAARPSVNDLLAIWKFDEKYAEPAPDKIVILDDMLTAGVHYRAAHTILSQRFPNARIAGFFLTRRALPKVIEDFDDFDDFDLQ